jgi:hypothetical protein
MEKKEQQLNHQCEARHHQFRFGFIRQKAMYQTQCQAHELTRATKLREQKCRKNYYGNSYYNSFRFVRVKEDLAEAKSKESQKLVVLTQQD